MNVTCALFHACEAVFAAVLRRMKMFRTIISRGDAERSVGSCVPRAHFKGRRVLYNCDDPYESNFVKYFAMNFNALGLKSLTATCYAASPFAQMTSR